VTGLVRAKPIDGAFAYRHPIEIRFVDTDALGHVNNATYFSYFEAARAGYHALVTGHAFGTGPDADRATFVIAEARIVYRSPARFGEPLTCACRVSWAGRSSFGLDYLVEAGASPLGEPRVVADGATVQVFYDLASGRVVRLPAELRDRMEALEGRSLGPRSAGDASG
jgi:acyl-CoA thioester hydrolase